MLVKLQMSFVLHGKITQSILEIKYWSLVRSSTGHCGFSEHVSIARFDKVDPSDPLESEGNWRRTPCITNWP